MFTAQPHQDPVNLPKNEILHPDSAHETRLVHGHENTTVRSHERARETPPAALHNTRARGGMYRQHLQRREEGTSKKNLRHGGGVGPTEEGIWRLRSHLRAKHRRQFENSDVRTRVRTSAEGKSSIRREGMGAGAGQELAGFGPTAIGAWGRPAHRRLKEQRLLLLNAPQQRPATIPQAEHDRAASARDLEVDVLGAHSTRSTFTSKIIWAR